MAPLSSNFCIRGITCDFCGLCKICNPHSVTKDNNVMLERSIIQYVSINQKSGKLMKVMTAKNPWELGDQRIFLFGQGRCKRSTLCISRIGMQKPPERALIRINGVTNAT